MDPSTILLKYNLEPEADYTWFDCESFSEAGNYISLLEELVHTSKGDFNANKITCVQGYTDKNEYYIVEILFYFQNAQHKIRILCEEWFDKDFIHQLNAIIAQYSGLTERFYAVRTGDQSMILIFASPDLKAQLEKEDMIDDLEDYTTIKPQDFDSLTIVEYR